MIRGFLYAVLSGTLAGTAFPVIILVLAIFTSSGSSTDLRAGLGIALAAVLIPGAFVIASAIMLGIPVTLLFKRLRWESAAAYTAAGACLGFLVPGTILAVAEQDARFFINGIPAGLLGAFSGAMTGRTWWRTYRQEVADDAA